MEEKRKYAMVKGILLSSNFWVLNKTIVRAAGAESALFLSVLAEAENYFQKEWFSQKSETIEEMTGMSNHIQTKCIKILSNMGLIEQQNRGIPMKRHFRLIYEKIAEVLSGSQFSNSLKTSFQKTSKLEFKDFKNLDLNSLKTTNKENIHKENIHKENREDIHVENSEILKKWNEFAIINNLNKILKLSKQRADKLKTRMTEKQFNFDQILNKIKQSDYLLGKINDWQVSFDFIVKNELNYIKILEGNYDNRRNNNGNSKTKDQSGVFKSKNGIDRYIEADAKLNASG